MSLAREVWDEGFDGGVGAGCDCRFRSIGITVSVRDLFNLLGRFILKTSIQPDSFVVDVIVNASRSWIRALTNS